MTEHPNAPEANTSEDSIPAFPFRFAFAGRRAWKEAVIKHWKQGYRRAQRQAKKGSEFVEQHYVYLRLAGSKELGETVGDALRLTPPRGLENHLDDLVALALDLSRKWARKVRTPPRARAAKVRQLANLLHGFNEAVRKNSPKRLADLPVSETGKFEGGSIVLSPQFLCRQENPRINVPSSNALTRTSIAKLTIKNLTLHEFCDLAKQMERTLRKRAERIEKSGSKPNWGKGKGHIRYSVYRASEVLGKWIVADPEHRRPFPTNKLIAEVVSVAFLTPFEINLKSALNVDPNPDLLPIVTLSGPPSGRDHPELDGATLQSGGLTAEQVERIRARLVAQRYISRTPAKNRC